MQNDYKRLVLSIVIVLLAGAYAFSQNNTEVYKNVILDGQPAKLNVATGEITLVGSHSLKQKDLETPLSETSSQSASNTSNYYEVKEGETLFEVATRFDTTMAALKKANNLETTLLKKGQRLRVRNLDQIDSIEGDVSASIEIKTPTNQNTLFHRVTAGETLYRIAKEYGIPVAQLKAQNGLHSNIITVGQKLSISEGYRSVGSNSYTQGSWTVSSGDTLYSIAKDNNISVAQIKSLNGLTSNRIIVGQKLRLK